LRDWVGRGKKGRSAHDWKRNKTFFSKEEKNNKKKKQMDRQAVHIKQIKGRRRKKKD
jgi:hypothetical protein